MPISVAISGYTDGEESRFAPPSDGYHAAVLADIIELGVRPGGQFGPKDEVILVWLTDEKNTDGAPKDQLQWVSNSLFMNKTTGKASNLRKAVIALRGGKDLTDEEATSKTHDIEQYIGSEAKILTEQYESKNGKTRSKVLQVKKADPGKGVAIPHGYIRDKNKPVADRLATKLGAVPKTAVGGKAAAAAVLSRPKSEPITDADIPF